MLLRHTVTALALAATMGINAAPANAAGRTAALAGPPVTGQLDEVGGSGPGLTCLGCVAAGIVTVSTIGWNGVLWMFLIGGAGAVTAGATVATCTAACATYLSPE